MLSVVFWMLQFSYCAEWFCNECHYTECHNAEFRYAGCRYANMTRSYYIHCYKTVQLNVDNLVQATETFSEPRHYVLKPFFMSNLSQLLRKTWLKSWRFHPKLALIAPKSFVILALLVIDKIVIGVRVRISKKK